MKRYIVTPESTIVAAMARLKLATRLAPSHCKAAGR